MYEGVLELDGMGPRDHKVIIMQLDTGPPWIMLNLLHSNVDLNRLLHAKPGAMLSPRAITRSIQDWPCILCSWLGAT